MYVNLDVTIPAPLVWCNALIKSEKSKQSKVFEGAITNTTDVNNVGGHVLGVVQQTNPPWNGIAKLDVVF